MRKSLGRQRIRLARSKLPAVLMIAILAIAIGLAIWWTRSGRPIQPPTTSATYSQADLQLAVEAVAAAEDADYTRAIELWQQLSDILPQDEDIGLNQAVTVLKWIDETNNVLSSGKIADPAQQAELESELEAAYLKADEIIGRLSQLETADHRATLLEAALLEAKSRRMSYPADVELRRQAAEVLRASLAEDPAQPLLACKFDELVQEVQTDGDGLTEVNADALLASWKTQPRNLYLLARAADTLLRNQDQRLLELLDPSLELTEPMLGLVASALGRVKPDELVGTVKQAINDGDWRAAGRLRLWLNLFKAMSFNSDRRLVQPDIMALLDTTFLSRLAADVAADTESVSDLPTYVSQDLDRSAQQIAWYDVDLDLDFELLALGDASLSLYGQAEQSQFELEQTFELGFKAQGFLIADLFEVDDPSRPRVPGSVAELMQDAGDDRSESQNSEQPSELNSSEVIASKRHDTLQELVVWGEQRVAIISVRATEDQRLEFYELAEQTGLEDLRRITSAVAFDIESDGDLDLMVAAGGGIHMMQNNGNRTFQDVSAFSQFEGLPDGIPLFSALVAVDYDADLDQDVLGVAAQSKSLMLIENLLHGQFRLRELAGARWPQVTGATDLSVADLDGNASWDWVISTETAINSVTTRTPEPGTVVAANVAAVEAAGQTIAVGDFNNDGWQDVLAGTAQGLQAFCGSIAGWSSASAETVGEPSGIVTATDVTDCNQDGLLDIAVVHDGRPKILTAQSAGDNNYLAVRVRGINDSNGGGRINHYAVGSTLEIWSGGRRQNRVIERPVSHFGLGKNLADNLRIIFTNGLTQNLESPPPNTLVEEIQELKGSCPFIYGWDGQRFQLITDLLWNAPLGLQVSRGQVIPDRRWEYLLLPGELVQPRNGTYELRVTEELWEVAYFDHLQLTAIDHPEDVQVFTNEKVAPPHLAEPELFVVGDRFELKAAFDSHDLDITDQLRSRDKQYVQSFRRLLCQGLAEPHFVELDFGPLPTQGPLKLILNGWLYPTDTSLNIGISQNDERPAPEPPSLWIVNEQGQWECVQPTMGFPGGKPKSIVVDLAGVFRSRDQRIRIASSQQIYWDEAFVSSPFSTEQIVEQPLQLESAELRYRGFSRLMPRQSDQPHWYDYLQVSSQPKWPALDGPFTRFGNVGQLLTADDNRLVVMTSGDEIVLRFSSPDRELPNGWKRDFVLHSTGWDKDADLNTLAGQGSLPLPFAEQQAYPVPPSQFEQATAVWELNADTLTRARPGPFPSVNPLETEARDYN